MDGRWLNAGERRERSSSPAPCWGSQVSWGRALGLDCSSSEREAREDEELTNLNWLHESKNLLMVMSLAGEALADSQPVQAKDFPPSPSPTLHQPQNASKPPYSFNCLIFMAIKGSPTQCLPVKEIYKWILKHYPYFKRAPVGWKNSVRHNLSLNRCFKRVEKHGREALGKGSFWCIDEESRPNLLHTIRKRALYIHSPPLGSCAADPLDPPYTQDPAGQIQEQLSEANREPCVTAALSHDRTSRTDNEESTLTNSPDLPFLPLWGGSRLTSRAPAPFAAASGDHNYSLVKADGWELLPPAPSDQERHRSLSERLSHDEDDDSEGFMSGGEWEMEDSSEDEEAKDSLTDSGYIPLSLREPPAVEGSEGSTCPGRREAVGFSDMDEELKEVAGSLLHLAGICG
ncbi:forkhead box protein N2-like [Heterodontus francisci]|uniref:forkhead box protein N2-like n=1 Tax=Heterodontus francisci TaxID=7792 RepID=UPI00355AD3F8